MESGSPKSSYALGKLHYAAPVLTVHGSVSELTRGQNLSPGDGNSGNGNRVP